MNSSSTPAQNGGAASKTSAAAVLNEKSRPPGRPMRQSYFGAWLLILACTCAAAEWIMVGRAFVRRTVFGPPPIPAGSRTERRFLALLLPPIASTSGKGAMSSGDLERFLDGLRAAGYVSIGLDDVREFYARGRLLPAKAVLIALAEDDPRGVDRADAALKEARWRGVLFITGTAAPAGDANHRLLTAHALEQMRLGGAWEFGAISREVPPSVPATGGIQALLDDDGKRPAPAGPGRYPIRFKASELGYNDQHDAPAALHMLAIRPDLGPQANLNVVSNAWPRLAPFADDFRAAGFGADWIAGWGVVSAGRRRLALLPTPQQTGAGVYLRGTEKWRDSVVEFDLKKYRKEFWAYARYGEDGGFVRVGAREGSWYVEQKTGPQSLPSMLARAPIVEGSLPAHVRLVLKGNSAIVHVNGRMQFGRVLRLNPAVAQGRIILAVYDARQRSAFAILSSFRARPADREWIAWNADTGRAGFDERGMDAIREQAVYAAAISPRWISIARDGRVSIAEPQGNLIRSLAGFYGCRLIPMADLRSFDPSDVGALASGLSDALRDLGAPGLNLRLRAESLARPETLRFLAHLRAGFHSRRRELWITVDGGGTIAPELAAAVDGVLRPAKASRSGDLELLKATHIRSASGPQWETAYNE